MEKKKSIQPMVGHRPDALASLITLLVTAALLSRGDQGYQR
jgi:hypothetical protein